MVKEMDLLLSDLKLQLSSSMYSNYFKVISGGLTSIIISVHTSVNRCSKIKPNKTILLQCSYHILRNK